MIYELNTCVNGLITKVFLKQFYFDTKTIVCPIHCHKYAEIHIIIDGKAEFLLETNRHVYYPGDVFIMPAERYHCGISADADTKHFAFQIAANIDKMASAHLSAAFLSEFMDALSRIEEPAGSAGFSALLSYICSCFIVDNTQQPKLMSDIAATIYEFVSQNYNRNIRISDLAEILHFSEKQTERLVKKYTGSTFKTILTRRRLLIAEFLEKNTDMNANQIAEYVGYANYSGLWKAKQKY